MNTSARAMLAAQPSGEGGHGFGMKPRDPGRILEGRHEIVHHLGNHRHKEAAHA